MDPASITNNTASNSNSSNSTSNKTTPILILDGGLGTSLEDKYNITFSTSTPLWSSHLLLPQSNSANGTGLSILRKCQSDFALAGADIILTATYQASIEGFKASGVSETNDIATKYLTEALRSATDAASLVALTTTTTTTKPDENKARERREEGRVALSIGPYGATMVPSTEYSGLYDEVHSNTDSLTAWHTERFETLFAPLNSSHNSLDKLGYIAFETLPRVDEILAVRKVMDRFKAASPTSKLANVPIWISCLFPGHAETLPDGSSVDEVVDALLGRKGAAEGIKMVPWGIGINCTKVGKLPSLVRRYEAAVRRLVEAGDIDEWPSLVLYPDGTNGEVYNTETKKWEVPDGVDVPKTPWEIQLADVVRSTSKSGSWRSILVGGCCKTTDKDIAKLRTEILELN